MELLLLWVLFGVVAAVVASNKGNSAVAWFFVGVLLGPIGLILSLVVSGDPAVVERKKIEGGGYRRCDKCAELIRAEATKCRFCGSDVEAVGTVGTGGVDEGVDGDQTKVGGTSNYDEFWKPVILGQLFGDELNRVADGEVVKIALSGLRRYGNRTGWSGSIRVWNSGCNAGNAAHMKSLARMLITEGVLKKWPDKVFRLSVNHGGDTLTIKA